MNNFDFIIILVIILIIIYFIEKKEKFKTDNTTNIKENRDLYNYFFQSFMNPYEESLNKFFSNDIESNDI
jgi:ABC-type cobalt transport system substrate-binding protein